MTIRNVLRNKGAEVHCIRSNQTVEDAVQALVENNCGSMLVCNPDCSESMVGIITERDILRITAAKMAPLNEILVEDVMSKDLIVGSPSDTVAEVMGLLTKHRIRHLPIVEGGVLKGLISIGDVVKAQFDELAMENHYLKSYIHS